jgi:hypothetical protein
MVSSHDFKIPASWNGGSGDPPGGPCLHDRGGFLAASGEFRWPSVGNFSAAYGEVLTAADTADNPHTVRATSGDVLQPAWTAKERAPTALLSWWPTRALQG